MNKTKISAKIVADSTSPQGDRLISLVLTYPRIIHAEMMTHRMFSRNASSSRAVPVDKMIKAVKENTFCPFEFQKSHKGMQGSEYFTGIERQECINLWLESAELALQQAEKMKAKGISKQIINRILEPYQYYTILITGSREGWENFFSLRMPEYHLENVPTVNEDLSLNSKTLTLIGKSKKELLKQINEIDNDSYTGFKNIVNSYSDLDWLKINKGQAEIHMMMLSEEIYDCIQESTPVQLKECEWHIPMISDLESLKLSTYDQIKLSVGRAANTSYTVVGDGKELTLEHAIKIHDKCVELVHSSVFEHCARAMSDEEYKVFIKGKNIGTIVPYLFDDTSKGWCNNLKGFIPYRYFIDNKIEI